MAKRYIVGIVIFFLGSLGAFGWLNLCKRAATPASSTLHIVATTSIIADMLRAVVGDTAQVTALMGPGVDPHTYKARDRDLGLLAEADILVYHGLHLEGRMVDLFAELARNRSVIAVTDGIDRSLLRMVGFDGIYDPHVWFDVSLWMNVVDYCAARLSEYYPHYADLYAERAARYGAQLALLHDECRGVMARIPRECRSIITAHDAFSYFGAAYGCDVHGLQGISTDADVSVRDIMDLVDMMVTKRIPVIFAETAVPHKGVEAVARACAARGWSVALADELYTDALGPVGSGAETYIGMMRTNLLVYTRAFKGVCS